MALQCQLQLKNSLIGFLYHFLHIFISQPHFAVLLVHVHNHFSQLLLVLLLYGLNLIFVLRELSWVQIVCRLQLLHSCLESVVGKFQVIALSHHNRKLFVLLAIFKCRQLFLKLFVDAHQLGNFFQSFVVFVLHESLLVAHVSKDIGFHAVLSVGVEGAKICIRLISMLGWLVLLPQGNILSR